VGRKGECESIVFARMTEVRGVWYLRGLGHPMGQPLGPLDFGATLKYWG